MSEKKNKDQEDLIVTGSEAFEVLPVLPLQDTVVFPEQVMPLIVGRPKSVMMAEAVIKGDKRLVLVTVKQEYAEDEAHDPTDVDDPSIGLGLPEGAQIDLAEAGPDDLYETGVEAQIQRYAYGPDNTIWLVVQALRRVKITRVVQTDPFLVAEVVSAPDKPLSRDKESKVLISQLRNTFMQITEIAPYLPTELRMAAQHTTRLSELVQLITTTVRLKTEDKQSILEEDDSKKRLKLLLKFLNQEREFLQIGSRIQKEVQGELSENQRKWYLRQELKRIQQELGEEGGDEVADLRRQLEEKKLPPEVLTAAMREIDRLQHTQEQMPEYGVIRGYLEWIVALPWSEGSEDNLDIKHAKNILDEDHYGLDSIKDRILDYLAVSQLTDELGAQILLFVSPPGTGKTSLGKSIARALGREFERISVGGVRDESEIRGHRRTYVGAMPGTIIRALRDAGTNNPVFMIDEIDKMGSDWRGDPSSAMLEVLDPEQNQTFRDHYLDLPFDLSKILFICTANSLDTIPAPLRDRMEIIRLRGYTEEEKTQIAKRYLLPRQLRAHGLKPTELKISKQVLQRLIRDYTQEAGVRELERQLAALCRKAARWHVEDKKEVVKITLKDLADILGQRKFVEESQIRTKRAGVSTGLAVTRYGGSLLFIETAVLPGSGQIRITGQLGDVMQESVYAALSCVRGILAEEDKAKSVKFFKEHDLHVHVPAGATPKDGPSAGIAIATALMSLYKGVPLHSDVAMTGEVTLTGDVLPIGGLKEKVLAAQRAGMCHVILPKANADELKGAPKDIRNQLTFHCVEDVRDVFKVSLPESADKSR